MSAPYRIFSLVESCPVSQHEGARTSAGEVGAATAHVSRWLDANPGRWFLVGERRSKNDLLGVNDLALRPLGYEAHTINYKVYARLPHASGLPLSDFVTKVTAAQRPDPLPALKRASFNWTAAELHTAVKTASRWLPAPAGSRHSLAA